MTDLVVTVSDQFADRLADAIARKLAEGSPAEPGPYDGQAPNVTQAPAQAPPDPWQQGGTTTGPSPGVAPSVPPPSQPPASSVTNAQPPSCAHGPRKYVPAGFSKKTGQPYPAFWACQLRDRASQCPGLPA